MKGTEGVTEDTPILFRDKNKHEIAIKSINIQQITGNERWEVLYSDESYLVEHLLSNQFGKQVWTPYGWQDIIGVQRTLYTHETCGTTKVVSDIGIAEMSDNCQVMCSDRKWKRVCDLEVGDRLASTFPGFSFGAGFRQSGIVTSAEAIKYAQNKRIPASLLNGSFDATCDFLIEYCSCHGYKANNMIRGQQLYYLLKKIRPESGILIKNSGSSNEYTLEMMPKERSSQNTCCVTGLIKNKNDKSIWIYYVQTESGVFQAGIGGLIIKSG